MCSAPCGEVWGHLYVYHEAGEPRPDRETPAAIVAILDGAPIVLPEPEETTADTSPPKRPPKVTHKVYGEGVYDHGPFCDCEWCAALLARSYVTIGGAS